MERIEALDGDIKEIIVQEEEERELARAENQMNKVSSTFLYIPIITYLLVLCRSWQWKV